MTAPNPPCAKCYAHDRMDARLSVVESILVLYGMADFQSGELVPLEPGQDPS